MILRTFFAKENRAFLVQCIGLGTLVVCALLISSVMREDRVRHAVEEAARKQSLAKSEEIMVRIDSLRTEMSWNNFINWYNSARIDTMEERKRFGR